MHGIMYLIYMNSCMHAIRSSLTCYHPSRKSIGRIDSSWKRGRSLFFFTTGLLDSRDTCISDARNLTLCPGCKYKSSRSMHAEEAQSDCCHIELLWSKKDARSIVCIRGRCGTSVRGSEWFGYSEFVNFVIRNEIIREKMVEIAHDFMNLQT